MDKTEVFGVVEIKVTWRLAWGLFWRWFLMSLGVTIAFYFILFLIFVAIGMTFVPFLGGW